MAKQRRKKLMLIGVAIGVVLLALIATVLIISALDGKEKDPYKQEIETSQSTSSTSDEKTQVSPSPAQNDADNSQGTSADSDNPPKKNTLDPSTVGTIDVEPLGVTVSYVKGVGAFEYEVLRRPNGTEYVEFRSSSLVGTKCTDDEGAFASILASPQADETATLAKTVEVEGTKYGLSLASDSCTSNVKELRAYQTSFGDAFDLLKVIK